MTKLPLEKLQCGAELHWVMNVENVVAPKHQTDSQHERSDVVIDHLLVNGQHVRLGCKTGGP